MVNETVWEEWVKKVMKKKNVSLPMTADSADTVGRS
jgi:hypothetical protein